MVFNLCLPLILPLPVHQPAAAIVAVPFLGCSGMSWRGPACVILYIPPKKDKEIAAWPLHRKKGGPE